MGNAHIAVEDFVLITIPGDPIPGISSLLRQAIAQAEVGEFDGLGMSPEGTQYFLYGPAALPLAQAAARALKERFDLPEGVEFYLRTREADRTTTLEDL